MKNLGTIVGVVALVAALGLSGAALATHVGAPSQYADTVVDYGTVGSSLVAPHTGPDNVLGVPDGTGSTGWFNLGSGYGDDGNDPEGFIIVRFDDNVVIPDGTGAVDLTVWEASSNGNDNDLADVYVSADGINWSLVGEARDYPSPVPGGNPPYPNDFDIDGTGLAFVKFVKLVNKVAPNNDGAKGFDSDAFEGLTSIGTDDIVKDFAINPLDGDAEDEIDVREKGDFSVQHKAFTIAITNNTGVNGGLAGLNFADAVPAEFDLDPDAESPTLNATNADCADGNCNGIAEDASGDCTVTATRNAGAGKGNNGGDKLEPELLSIDASALDDGATCITTVYVVTDDGHKKSATPTSCPVNLNSGVKVFDAVLNLLLQDDDKLIFDLGVGTDGYCNDV